MNQFFKYLLPTSDKSTRIEYKLFEISLFLTWIVFLFWSVYGFTVKYEAFVQSVYVSGVFIFSTMYFLQKKGKYFRTISLVYYYLLLLMLGISWLPSGGVRAAIPEYIALIFISGLLVLPIKDYLVFILATFGMVLGLTLYEISNPNAAVKYPSEALLLQDLSISTLIMLVIAGLSLFIFKRTYIEDRRELRRKNKELSEEKYKAESTDRAKTTFLATVSHEMRTPLNGIVGMVELLQKTKLDKDQEELLESLSYSSNILHGLIRNVLDITIIEAGKLELHQKIFSLKAELEELTRVFEEKLTNRPNVKLQLDINKEMPDYLEGDLSRIRQVILNLMNNSYKFTNRGTIVLKSEFLGQVEDLATVRFSITDTGTGIPLSKQEHLFETFYKASDSDGIEGTGLGLAIVEKLVTLMGGTIGFSSEEGEGSEFYFVLPLRVVEKMESNGFEKVSIPGLNQLKVLIVEDVKINRLVAEKMLRSLGIEQIEIAENGTKGVEKATKDFFNIIFMDLQMPDISGFEASEQIKNFYQEESRKPIIIALTANALKKSMEECYAVGMSDYLLKPVKSEILQEVLMKYLNYN